ncbi:hypothetical protein AUEXF2481DRAFT_503864 [Aureobasidium subglaciale EXF-2481]|uniref:Uncharacterized protein n=1 Tax=Aureobasidium subglaciale (strain EXF-2481) TaxID=1043005 RepID=A0A074Y601_AURSE|nr:uncharacterized protein AUEXF2481DRAFT_503864 [Aureobasidium subglaciale EXF-2481]KEQ91409.1 hypothetical protein AUEXF2481DRAFT_503864 [Aureobasidium subglaciale EXF-2481]
MLKNWLSFSPPCSYEYFPFLHTGGHDLISFSCIPFASKSSVKVLFASFHVCCGIFFVFFSRQVAEIIATFLNFLNS